jgi:hypothetical protein
LGSRFFGLLDWFLSLYMVLGCLLFWSVLHLYSLNLS